MELGICFLGGSLINTKGDVLNRDLSDRTKPSGYKFGWWSLINLIILWCFKVT